MDVDGGDEQLLAGRHQSVLHKRSSENVTVANSADDHRRVGHSSASRTVEGHRETDATHVVRTMKTKDDEASFSGDLAEAPAFDTLGISSAKSLQEVS